MGDSRKTITDIERRRPVWHALSDLFLDTELQEMDYLYIARVLAESGYANPELQRTLEQEVFPVCIGSLISLVGEWAGFSLDWLEEKILRNVGHEPPPVPVFAGKSAWWVIEPAWQEVLARLPKARHVYGNAFQPYPDPRTWPIVVVQLAEALCNGADCAFALHDALLDAGHPELADHFRREREHPVNCWVLDMIRCKRVHGQVFHAIT